MAEAVGDPTPVVFFRGLSPDTTEQDIYTFAARFGTVAQLLLLKLKRIAFVQFHSVEEAVSLVHHFQHTSAMIHGQRVFVKFSDKLELTGGVASAPLPTAPMITPVRGPAMEPVAGVGGGRVLLVTLEGLTEAISMDDVYHLFNTYSAVVKISSFVKGNKNHVLIEFTDPIGAQRALSTLQNADVGVCRLHIQPSNLAGLNFVRDDDRNRTYAVAPPPSHRPGPIRRPVGPPPVLVTASGRPSLPYSRPAPPIPQASHAPHAPHVPHGSHMPHVHVGMVPASSPYTPVAPAPGGLPGSILLVNGLDEARVTAAVLFTLFGLYGEVRLVKTLFKKRDSALVQFATPAQAQQARTYLNGLELYGRPMAVCTSKNADLTVGPKDDASLVASPMTHRPTVYNGKTVAPPSATLHLSNIHPDVTEEELRRLFVDYGEVVGFEYFKTTARMAKIELSSVGEAVSALIGLNYYVITLPSGKACTLHVAFSKHPIKHVETEAP